jgi:hypothetical protein
VAYDQHASAACGTEFTVELPPSSLGTEICDALDRGCTREVEPEWCEQTNTAAAWLRDDVQHAVRSCFGRPCDFMLDCVNAWLTQVYPAE